MAAEQRNVQHYSALLCSGSIILILSHSHNNSQTLIYGMSVCLCSISCCNTDLCLLHFMSLLRQSYRNLYPLYCFYGTLFPQWTVEAIFRWLNRSHIICTCSCFNDFTSFLQNCWSQLFVWYNYGKKENVFWSGQCGWDNMFSICNCCIPDSVTDALEHCYRFHFISDSSNFTHCYHVRCHFIRCRK